MGKYIILKMPRTVSLYGGSPWGFRLVGGKDFHAPLAVSKVTPGGKAEKSGIQPGMKIVKINQNETSIMSHLEAQNKVKESGSTLTLLIDDNHVQNNGSTHTVSTSGPAPSSASKHTSSVSFTPSSSNSSAKAWQPSKINVTLPKPDDDLPPPPANLTYGMEKVTLNDPLPPPPSNTNAYSAPTNTYSPPTPSTTYSQKGNDQEKDSICAGCKQIIRGPYLTALGQCWHPEEFVCASQNCRKPLQNVGFIEEQGKMYCKDCYEKHFAHTCGKCHNKIVGEVMHALNKTWHMTCFVCTQCSKPFTDGVFHLENDKPYCVEDFNRLFSTNCKGCNFPIAAGDHYLEALDGQWHDSCFNCAVCHCDLKNVGFYASCNKPVCSNHKNAKISQ